MTVCASLLLALTGGASAQTGSDPIVMEVGGQQIRRSEFAKDFDANIGRQLKSKPGVGLAERRAALEDYATLYATFRAKLIDAHVRGFDTSSALHEELMRYRKELAAPYLIDSTVLKQLLDEAYERNHYSLHAAHILVTAPPDAKPEDTMRALNRINGYYSRIVDKGEDFFAVSQENFLRMNPGSQPRANEGDLGYFTVFDMVYPFENAAYALKVGEVSRPVRTRYGYHLIKLLDRVELYGKVTMAHIWLHSPDSASRQNEIFSIYSQLSEGIPFERLARQSDDRTTANTGGVLEDASLSQLPPEYIHQLVGMKEGQFSRPFFTQYGWHIIKLIKRDTLPQPADLDGFYKQRLARDMRGEQSRKVFAANCRTKYGIVDLTMQPVKVKGKRKGAVKMAASLDALNTIVPDSVCYGKWVMDESAFTDTSALIVTPDRRYTSLDIARYIATHQQRGTPELVPAYVRHKYDEFLDSISIDYADRRLEQDYPEFAQVIEEYRRGLMIFNYNDAMIWHKALNDTVGFVDFYNRESVKKRLDVPEDSIYFFHPRARVTIIDVSDSTALKSDKAQKIITKAQKKEKGSREMRELLLKKIDHKRFPDDIVTVDVTQVEQTRQNILSNDQWQKGVYLQSKDAGYRLLVVEEILPRSLKGILSARGYYLNAWQNEVERQLNDELWQKYNVKINHNVVRSIAD